MKNGLDCQGYRNAYSYSHAGYTYWHDYSTKVTLRVGEDGVTEDHIKILKREHIAERNCMRRGRNNARERLIDGQMVMSTVVSSLDAYSEQTGDCGTALVDRAADVEGQLIRREEFSERLDRAFNGLTDGQRELFMRVIIDGAPITQSAREEGVGESAIRDRLSRIKNKINVNRQNTLRI